MLLWLWSALLNKFLHYDDKLKEIFVNTKFWLHGPIHIYRLLSLMTYLRSPLKADLWSTAAISLAVLWRTLFRERWAFDEKAYLFSHKSQQIVEWRQIRKTNFAFPQSDCLNRLISVVPIYKNSLRIGRVFMNKDSYICRKQSNL